MVETNLKMFRGDTFSRTFTVYNDDVALDLTNCTVRMTFKWIYADADVDAVITLTEGSGITVDATPTTGKFTFTLAPSDTSSFPPRVVDLKYDAQVTDASDNVYTVSYGKLTVLPDVSVTAP